MDLGYNDMLNGTLNYALIVLFCKYDCLIFFEGLALEESEKTQEIEEQIVYETLSFEQSATPVISSKRLYLNIFHQTL
jgi:hypothetical protein